MSSITRYPVIEMDYPWDFKAYSPKGDAIQNRHYKTAPNAEIVQLPIGDIATPDCSLFVWATWPLMGELFRLYWENGGQLWGGFKYKTCAFIWVKANKTSNSWFRGNSKSATQANSEPCLYFSRGKPKRLYAGVGQIVTETCPSDFLGLPLETETLVSRVERHSQKPLEAYKRIENLFSGPYLRLYARDSLPGWVSLGNEITGRDMAVDLELLSKGVLP